MSRITGSEVKNMMEAYSAVYAPEEITEEQVWEEVENWVNSLLEEGYDLSDFTWEDMYENYLIEGGKESAGSGGDFRRWFGKRRRELGDIIGAGYRGAAGQTTTSTNPISRTSNAWARAFTTPARDVIFPFVGGFVSGAPSSKKPSSTTARPAPQSPAKPRTGAPSISVSGGSKPPGFSISGLPTPQQLMNPKWWAPDRPSGSPSKPRPSSSPSGTKYRVDSSGRMVRSEENNIIEARVRARQTVNGRPVFGSVETKDGKPVPGSFKPATGSAEDVKAAEVEYNIARNDRAREAAQRDPSSYYRGTPAATPAKPAPSSTPEKPRIQTAEVKGSAGRRVTVGKEYDAFETINGVKTPVKVTYNEKGEKQIIRPPAPRQQEVPAPRQQEAPAPAATPARPATTTSRPAATPAATPAAPSRPAPVVQTGNKETDRAAWEKANPRLAEVERLRAQQRSAGKSVFDTEFRKNVVNPVMYNKNANIPNSGRRVEVSQKAFPNKPDAAQSKSTSTPLVSPNGRKYFGPAYGDGGVKATAAIASSPTTPLVAPGKNPIKSSYEYDDAFDLVLEYLLSQGHVDTLEEALYVMMEMSSETIQDIVEQQGPGRTQDYDLPGAPSSPPPLPPLPPIPSSNKTTTNNTNRKRQQQGPGRTQDYDLPGAPSSPPPLPPLP